MKPLHSPWSWWFEKHRIGTQDKDYHQSLQCLKTIDSMESFCKHYQFLNRPSRLISNESYAFFRSTTEPAWESFPKGTTLTLRLRKDPHLIDKCWEICLMCCICEIFKEPLLVGVSLIVREHLNDISFWFSSTPNVNEFIVSLQPYLKFEPNVSLYFKHNEESIKDNNLHKNAVIYRFPRHYNQPKNRIKRHSKATQTFSPP